MNESLFLFLNAWAGRSAFFDVLIIFFAQYFIFIFVGLALAFILWGTKERRKTFILLFGGAFLAWVVSQFINEWYSVARPFLALEGIRVLFEHGGNDSFPSGHATFSFALAFAALYFDKLWGALFLGGAFLIGFSRVIAGVHWPSDIIGGFILGGAMVVFVFCVYKKNQP